MCVQIGKVKISIGEQSTPGKEVSRSSFLQKGDTATAGQRFIIATIGEQCIFMPVDGAVRSTFEGIISAFLARGVVVRKNRKISVPIHVYISVPVTDIGERFGIDIGLSSIQTRYNATVPENSRILIRREN